MFCWTVANNLNSVRFDASLTQVAWTLTLRWRVLIGQYQVTWPYYTRKPDTRANRDTRRCFLSLRAAWSTTCQHRVWTCSSRQHCWRLTLGSRSYACVFMSACPRVRELLVLMCRVLRDPPPSSSPLLYTVGRRPWLGSYSPPSASPLPYTVGRRPWLGSYSPPSSSPLPYTVGRRPWLGSRWRRRRSWATPRRQPTPGSNSLHIWRENSRSTQNTAQTANTINVLITTSECVVGLVDGLSSVRMSSIQTASIYLHIQCL